MVIHWQGENGDDPHAAARRRLDTTFAAQFGRPLPHPVASIDTILQHSQDETFFRGSGNACNVLDVAHPLWLCLKQTDHRRAEAEDWARERLSRVLQGWRDGEGFSFGLDESPASLQGIEMWLSIIYILADLLGSASELGYCPQGVHRPRPADA